uniref:DHC_N1 domain-containing protein n=1 Tax=Elaeophora elaphi TaxID=1147741 RepID=A0A0R3RTW4_9BILA
MECLSKIRIIEKCINDIINFVDMWRNLDTQLEATKKEFIVVKLTLNFPEIIHMFVKSITPHIFQMPRYTSLMLHSSNWQSRLAARIELEINFVASKLFELWEQIEKAADALNDLVTDDWDSQEIVPSFCFREDLQHLLSYLMVEVIKWYEMHHKTYSAVITPMKPNVKIEKVIARCKQTLQALANNASKKSS